MQMLGAILFAHIAATIGLFVALAIEWVAVTRLRRAVTYEQAREWATLWSSAAPVGVPSFLVALLSGVYLAKTLGVWELDWTSVAVPTLVVVAIAAGVVRPRRNRLLASISTNSGRLPQPLSAELRQPLLVQSLRLRAAVLVGLVFLMTVKPDRGLLVILAVGSLGALWGFAARKGPPVEESR